MCPIYEFRCHPCDYVTEKIRQMGDYNAPNCDKCDEEMDHIISIPKVQVWNTSYSFPNVTQHGDGTLQFDNKSSYEKHLEDNNVGEFSTNAPVKTAHGTEVTVYR